MKRRNLFALLGGLAAIGPLGVAAQQAKVPTIGVLVISAPGADRFWRLFRDGMHGLGYIEGQTIRYELRSDPEVGRLPALAVKTLLAENL